MIKLRKIEPVRLLFGTLEAVGGLRGRLVPADADTNSGSGEQEAISGYSYNGVILPALPEWDKAKYPYVVIKRDNSSSDMGLWREDHMFTAFFLTEPCAFKEGTLFTNATLQFTSNGNYAKTSIDYLSKDSMWSTPVEHTGVSNIQVGSGLDQQKYIVWSNYTVKNATDGEVVRERSDPAIPGEILGCRYGRYSAPRLPELFGTKYQYAVIYNTIAFIGLDLMVDPYIYDAETGAIISRTTSYASYLLKTDNGFLGEWELSGEYMDDSMPGFSATQWTSYDVMSTDGTVYFAGTKPVPAYD